MNLIETSGESLFSGGEYSNGRIYLPVHDATMDCSTGIKYVANLYIIMRDKAEMETLGLIASGG